MGLRNVSRNRVSGSSRSPFCFDERAAGNISGRFYVPRIPCTADSPIAESAGHVEKALVSFFSRSRSSLR